MRATNRLTNIHNRNNQYTHWQQCYLHQSQQAQETKETVTTHKPRNNDNVVTHTERGKDSAAEAESHSYSEIAKQGNARIEFFSRTGDNVPKHLNPTDMLEYIKEGKIKYKITGGNISDEYFLRLVKAGKFWAREYEIKPVDKTVYRKMRNGYPPEAEASKSKVRST